MREVLESQPGLHIRQAEVVDLVIEEAEPLRMRVPVRSRDMGDQTNSRDPAPVPAPRTRPQTARRPPPAGRRHHHHHRHLPQRPHPLRRGALSGRPQRRASLRAARRGAARAWAFDLPPQDRHAAAPRRPHHPLGRFEEQPGDADPTPSASAPGRSCSRR